ncbi:TPA: hypothetical protein SIA35_004246 [Aeromonas sobria]|nr:hypothetical protein [Aeromonas sobria]
MPDFKLPQIKKSANVKSPPSYGNHLESNKNASDATSSNGDAYGYSSLLNKGFPDSTHPNLNKSKKLNSTVYRPPTNNTGSRLLVRRATQQQSHLFPMKNNSSNLTTVFKVVPDSGYSVDASLPLHQSSLLSKQQKFTSLGDAHSTSHVENSMLAHQVSTDSYPSSPAELKSNVFTNPLSDSVSKDRITGSFYLESISENKRPSYVRFPLAKIPDVDPTEVSKGKKMTLYHGGFFDPRDVKSEGLLPFKNVMDKFDRFREENPNCSMSQYIEDAQLRRVNGNVQSDPFRSCTLEPKQAFKFAPRVPTDDKLPNGIAEYIKSIYKNSESYLHPPLSSKIQTTLWYKTSNEGESIPIDIVVRWGPYTEKVIDNLISVATTDLARDVFGPFFGYAAVVETTRGHPVKYDFRMGDHGAIKKDYREEQEVNIFGGIKGDEIAGFVPVWGAYMNPKNNYIVHPGDTGNSDFDNAVSSQTKYNKFTLKSEEYGRLQNWRSLSKSFASQLKFKNMLGGLKRYVSSDSFKVHVIPGSGSEYQIIPEGLDSIFSYGVTCDIMFKVNKDDLKPGNYIFSLSSEDEEENIEGLSDLERPFNSAALARTQNMLEQAESDVKSGMCEFIDNFEHLSKIIPRTIY